MQIRFAAQPFADGSDLAHFIRAVAGDERLTSLDVIVAWAKRSGLSRLHDDLLDIRGRPGHTRLVVGIDEGGATRQGLEMARSLFDVVYVFHDRSGRTFHPKVYSAWGQLVGRILVGSHNATAGGVYFNYEAGLDCDLDLPADATLLDSVHGYVGRLLGDTALCKELSDELLAELVGNPRYRIEDEDAGAAPPTDDLPENLDAEIDVDNLPDPRNATPSIFGGSAEPKRGDPGAVPVAKKAVAKKLPPKKATATKKTGTAVAAPHAVQPVAAVTKRWFKRLSKSDAQHPPTAGSNVTGVLRLVRAGHLLDQTNYFRLEFFGPLPWAATPKPRGVLESTVVPFEVTINGVAQGAHNLRVDHAPYREAGQGNHTTALHWDDLGPTLAATDYTGYFVILERLANGTYRLEVAPADPGPGAFIP